MKYLAYYRVSTKNQGKSGLGLASQKSAVLNFIKNEDGELVKEYTDVESGTSTKKRINLLLAIEEAKVNDYTLLIAKLDRLSRNLHFISSLLESGVKFICCDQPNANNFTIHIYSALAEMEAKLISERTRNALAELKLKGVKLGNPQGFSPKARKHSLTVRKENAQNNPALKQAEPIIKLLRKKGMSYNSIAISLNDIGLTTRFNKKYYSTQVKRICDRIEI